MCEKSVLIVIGKVVRQPVPGNTRVELPSTPPSLPTQVASPPPASALPSSSLPPTLSVPAFQDTVSADPYSLPDSPLPSTKEKGKGRALPEDGMDVDDEEVLEADEGLEATSSLVMALNTSVDSMIWDTLTDQEDARLNVPDVASQEEKIPSSLRLPLVQKSTSRWSSPASSLTSLPG